MWVPSFWCYLTPFARLIPLVEASDENFKGRSIGIVKHVSDSEQMITKSTVMCLYKEDFNAGANC